MKLTIISDFLCPYCYIADKHLELALEKLPYRDEVEIVHQSFQLYPDLSHEDPISLYDMMKQIKNLSHEHVEYLLCHIREAAKNIGLVFDFDNLKYTNTLKAHRVFKYADKHGKGNEFFRLIYEDFFTHGRVITETPTLLRATDRLGLDDMEVLEVIHNEDLYKDEVLQDVDDSYAIEVWSVPFLAFDEKYGIYGGRSVESIISVMDKIYDGSIVHEKPSYKNEIKFIKVSHKDGISK